MKTRTRSGAVRGAVIPTSRTITMRAVRALLARIWSRTAPEQGFTYDFTDLTDAKLAWRRNLLTETEFRNGLSDVVLRGGLITASTMSGYAGALAFGYDGTTTTYGYKQYVIPAAGITYSFMALVQMDDNGVAPTSQDLTMLIRGSVVSFTATPTGTAGRYWVIGSSVSTVPGNANFGLVKYNVASSRTFRVTAYHLNVGSAQPYQALTDVATEFIAAWPGHTLYQDQNGAVPTWTVEQPVGMVLDARYAGERGLDLVVNRTIGGVAAGGAALTTYGTGAIIGLGKWYEISVDVSGYSGTGDVGFVASNFTAVTDVTRVQNNRRMRGIVYSSGGEATLFTRSTNTATFSNITIREVFGNPATQPTPGDRPTITGRVNLLNSTEVMSDGTYWTKSGAGTGTAPVVTDNYGVAPDGTITATRLQMALNGGTTTADQSRILHPINTVIQGNFYLHSFWAKTNDGSTKQISLRDDFAQTTNAIITITPTWQQFVGQINTAASNTTVNAISLWLRGAIGTSDSVDMLVWHPQTERSTTAPGKPMPYQRVGATAVDYDPIGFPKGAKWNGANTWMATAALDLSASDKLMAGVSFRKDGEPTTAIDVALIEVGTLYAAGSGRVVLASSVGGTNNAGFYVRGSSANTGAATALVAGSSAVLSGTVDWNVDTASRSLRLNSAVLSTGTGAAAVGGATQTGAAGQVIYLGRRGGNGTSFNGVIYRATLRGADWNNAVAANDRWLNEPIKVYT